MAFNQHIFVTNRNTFTHIDKCNGEEYVFPPSEPVLIPVDAATHMLGYGLKDLNGTLLRLGWANKYDPAVKNYVEDPEGVRKLANFVFEEAKFMPKSALAAALGERGAGTDLEIA